ncbi:14868_t:CDS:1, partial [Cetraspora pellucida]
SSPSNVPEVFKLLISLALLRPISDCESKVIKKWYDDYSTRVKLCVNLKKPALNHCDTCDTYMDHSTSAQLSFNAKKTALNHCDTCYKEMDTIYEEVDIFNFMTYILLEMKFFTLGAGLDDIIGDRESGMHRSSPVCPSPVCPGPMRTDCIVLTVPVPAHLRSQTKKKMQTSITALHDLPRFNREILFGKKNVNKRPRFNQEI